MISLRSESGRIRLGQVLLTLAAIALMLIALTVFRAPDDAVEVERPGATAPRVVASEVGMQPFELEVGVVGRVSPWREVDLAAEVGGRVEEVRVDIGDRVTVGELLLTLETADYEVAVREAEAALLRARARVDESEAALTRMEALRRRGAVSEREYEAALATQRAAAADLRTAEAGLERAADDLDDTRVTAPFPGTIVERGVDAGALVSGDRTLLVLADLDTVAVEVGLTEREIFLARQADEAFVVSTNHDGLSASGVIDGIAERADPATGTYLVRIRVDNDGAERFLGGMVVDVRIPYARLDPIPTVPAAAVLSPDGDPHLFVVRDGRAVRLNLDIVARDDDHLGVLPRGYGDAARRGLPAANGDGVTFLDTGEPVVVVGQTQLVDGDAVEITNRR